MSGTPQILAGLVSNQKFYANHKSNPPPQRKTLDVWHINRAAWRAGLLQNQNDYCSIQYTLGNCLLRRKGLVPFP